MEEILHQLIGSLSHYLKGFIHPRWCRISSMNSMEGLFLLSPSPPKKNKLSCTCRSRVFWGEPTRILWEMVGWAPYITLDFLAQLKMTKSSISPKKRKNDDLCGTLGRSGRKPRSVEDGDHDVSTAHSAKNHCAMSPPIEVLMKPSISHQPRLI